MPAAVTTLDIRDANAITRTMRVWDESGTGVGPYSFMNVRGNAGLTSIANITRPANQTLYTARDVLGAAAAALTFANAAQAAGDVKITSIEIEADIAAIPAGQTSWELHMYSVTPPSALADNAIFDIPAGDRASYLGVIPVATMFDYGASLYVRADKLDVIVKAASTSLFGYLVTVGTFTPAANSEVYKVTLHTSPV